MPKNNGGALILTCISEAAVVLVYIPRPSAWLGAFPQEHLSTTAISSECGSFCSATYGRFVRKTEPESRSMAAGQLLAVITTRRRPTFETATARDLGNGLRMLLYAPACNCSVLVVICSPVNDRLTCQLPCQLASCHFDVPKFAG